VVVWWSEVGDKELGVAVCDGMRYVGNMFWGALGIFNKPCICAAKYMLENTAGVRVRVEHEHRKISLKVRLPPCEVRLTLF